MLNKKALAASLSAKETDADFKQTVLLLHGDGTNGAQNNTFLDSSTNAFSITRNGNTTQGTFSPFSQTGWSNYFDGTGDYLNLTTNSAFLAGTGDFTFELFVYVTNSSTLQGVVDVGFNSGGYGFYVGDGQILFRIAGGLDIAANISNNQWNHVAVCRSGSAISLYLNGSRIATSTNTTNITTSSTTYIGCFDGAGTFPFTGYLANIRIVKGTALYTGTTYTVPTSSLTAVSGTGLLTCQSNRFVDNSSNGFTITRNGDVSVQAFSPFAPTAAYDAATNGGSGYFDGSGDYLTAPSNAVYNLGTSAFTIEAWIYLTAGTTDRTIFERDSGACFMLQYTGASRFEFSARVGDGGGTIINYNASSYPVLNNWVHVAIVRSSNTFTLYLNGVSVASATNSVSIPTSTLSVGIGGRGDGSGNNVQGYISNLRFSTSAVYTSGFSVPTAPFTQSGALLLNFTNAGIIDQTAKNALETVDNAQIDTGTKKFGTGSLEFDGTGDYLIMRNTPDFIYGTGDFTIEFFVRFASTGEYMHMYDQRPASTDGAYPSIRLNSAGNGLEYVQGGSVRISGGSISTNTWYHIALSRSGTSTKLFLDGTQVGSTYTDSTNYTNGSNRPYIGGSGYHVSSLYLNGFIDDLRITKGKARYTANFTAPTKAFPDL